MFAFEYMCMHVVLRMQAYRHTSVTRHVHRHANVIVYGILDMCEHA